MGASVGMPEEGLGHSKVRSTLQCRWSAATLVGTFREWSQEQLGPTQEGRPCWGASCHVCSDQSTPGTCRGFTLRAHALELTYSECWRMCSA